MPAGLTVIGLIGRRAPLDIPECPDGNVTGIRGALCDLLGRCVCRLDVADYQRRYPFYQSLIFHRKAFFLTTLGTARMTPSTTTWLFMQPTGLTSHLREFMMPNVMNGLKAADTVRANRRKLLIAMGVAMVLGLLVSYYSVLKVSYQHGALHVHTGGSGGVRWLSAVLNSPRMGTDWTNTGFYTFRQCIYNWIDVDAKSFRLVADFIRSDTRC